MTTAAQIRFDQEDKIGIVTLDRPEKRNAVTAAMMTEFGRIVDGIPEGVRAIVLTGAGTNFCAGLDLVEQQQRSPVEVLQESRRWHDVLERLQFSGRPVIAALHGAVIGGGLEIASAAHIRVAESSTYYQLPEGRRGIYVGGGASVRVARLIGTQRMMEMMLTGRTIDCDRGDRYGFSDYVVGEGEGMQTARDLALNVAGNSTLVNYMVTQALPRISDMAASDGFFTESLAAALSQTSADAQEGIQAFIDRRKNSFDR